VEYMIATKPMSKWDKRFVELAKYVAQWSKDPNAKVGAVVFSRKGGSISIGYNGFPMGVEDSVERLSDKDVKLELVVHAEINALIAAGSRAAGSTVYVWGKPVCARCAGPIIQAGVKRVVAEAPGTSSSRWDASGIAAHEMFEEAGIEVDFYNVAPCAPADAPAAQTPAPASSVTGAALSPTEPGVTGSPADTSAPGAAPGGGGNACC
jgi:dCMP deaminase